MWAYNLIMLKEIEGFIKRKQREAIKKQLKKDRAERNANIKKAVENGELEINGRVTDEMNRVIKTDTTKMRDPWE